MSKIADSVRISSPCSEDWNEMEGTEKIRFCSHCSRDVNDLSKMTRAQASRLVKRAEGRICVRYIPDPLTGAPVFTKPVYGISRRPSIAAGVLSAAIALSGSAYAQGEAVRISPPEKQIRANNLERSKKADQPFSDVSGFVTDSAGAVVPGATVNLKGKDFERSVAADEAGFYSISNIPAGDLSITIEAAAFTTVTRQLSMAAGSSERTDIELEPAETFVTMGVMAAVEYEQPLVRAVAEDDAEEVSELVSRGANVNAKDSNYSGVTALSVAVENGDIEMVELLLNAGADPNIRSDNGRTALLALEYDTTAEMIRLLLNHGAKISVVDDEGNNALHRAAENNEPEVIRLLLAEGIDINSRNKEGETPLMIAAYYEVPETVQALLDAGAEVNLRNDEGETALTIAKGEEGEDAEKIVRLLIQYGARE